jgi:hypothetical protein
LVNDAGQPPVCSLSGGRHRTGIMTARHRMARTLTADRAYDEMRAWLGLHFFTQAQRFVYDYYGGNSIA